MMTGREKFPLSNMRPIEDIAQKLGIKPEYVEKYGNYKAKINLRQTFEGGKEPGKLVLITAMTPTPAGEGKTTTAIGLTDALNRLGKKTVVALREPSLGPVFGMKGGATGGGKAKVVPSEDINLHFTGDIHAITSAHNLLAAMVDNRLHFDNVCGLLDAKNTTWKRVLDINDRSLRDIVTGIGETFNGIALETGFDITAASEVMAVFCLARDLADLKDRLGRIQVGYGSDGKPVTAAQIKAQGAMAALLKDALRPNLVQTMEGSPAFIHGGPFANIAHGTNSVIATRMALGLADYVVTECGFASDLGAEKFIDIVVRTGSVPEPAAVVIVATLRSLKFHGGVKLEALNTENIEAVGRGFENLQKHIENIRHFGLPLVVALNKFPADTENEMKTFAGLCAKENVRFALSDVFGRGGEGGADLGREVLEAVEKDERRFQFLYPIEMPLAEKIETIARKIYGAGHVAIEAKAARKLHRFEADGFGLVPVCIAKTQYSLSDNAKALGRPRDFTVIVTDAFLCAGAGFVVALCGEIMTMPGLPMTPAAEKIAVTDDGEITGILG
ncbi:MAG: formate--tetrahydrofolate ligase [Candidatus Aminicenantales bacterium]